MDEEEEPEPSGPAISRSLPLMPTVMEAEDEEESHIQEAIKQFVTEPDRIAIPTPKIKIVSGYDDSPNPTPFVRPQAYICFRESSAEDWLEKVMYDLDEEDSKFLRKFNGSKKNLTENNLELIIDRCEKEAVESSSKLPQVSLIQKRLPQLKPTVIQSVYNYWTKRRKKNDGNPLIPELMDPPEPDDTSPFKPFRKRGEEFKQAQRRGRKNDTMALMKMKQLRQEMEKARTLLEMIKRREKIKRELFEVATQSFEVQCSQIKQIEEKDKEKSPPNKRRKKSSPTRQNKKSEPKVKRLRVSSKKKKSPNQRRKRRPTN